MLTVFSPFMLPKIRRLTIANISPGKIVSDKYRDLESLLDLRVSKGRGFGQLTEPSLPRLSCLRILQSRDFLSEAILTFDDNSIAALVEDAFACESVEGQRRVLAR